LTPTLDWNNVTTATEYNLLVATDSLFNNIILDIPFLNFTEFQIPAPYLTYVTKYYWKVNATNSVGTGAWSAVWNFTTRQVQPPAAPNLTQPPNNSTNVSLTPLLDWQNSSNAIYYRVNIATDLNFNNMVLNRDSITASFFDIPPNILNVNTLYFWRVNANNAGGSSLWSSTFIFRTVPTGINQIGMFIPDKYELYNNYPNPFNPVTKIRFDLPRSSSVRILLYDITGKVVMNLVDESLQAGSYETTLDASSLSSGLYFYRIETADFSNTKRLMLIK
ncbi:MAG: T9SS type A sorting domain-containing protein, partial [Ignavibacteria bacterium]